MYSNLVYMTLLVYHYHIVNTCKKIQVSSKTTALNSLAGRWHIDFRWESARPSIWTSVKVRRFLAKEMSIPRSTWGSGSGRQSSGKMCVEKHSNWTGKLCGMHPWNIKLAWVQFDSLMYIYIIYIYIYISCSLCVHQGVSLLCRCTGLCSLGKKPPSYHPLSCAIKSKLSR